MIPGQRNIARTEELLQRRDYGAKQRLERAAQEFWSAYYYWDAWPEPLRREALALRDRLLAHGPITATVTRLEESDVEEVTQDLAAFVRRFRDWHLDDPNAADGRQRS